MQYLLNLFLQSHQWKENIFYWWKILSKVRFYQTCDQTNKAACELCLHFMLLQHYGVPLGWLIFASLSVFFLSNVRKVFTFCRQFCENAYLSIADVSRFYADKLLVLCYNLAFLKKHQLNHFKQHLFVKVSVIYD